MFWPVLLLFFLGFVLIMLEALMPFGISFTVGCGLMIVGVYLMWRADPQTGIVLLVIAVPLAAFAGWLVFRHGVEYLKLTPPPAGAGAEDDDVPGEGTIVTVCQALHPTGTVQWQGRRYPARSLRLEMEWPIGARVCVRGRDSIYLLVDDVKSGSEGSDSEAITR